MNYQQKCHAEAKARKHRLFGWPPRPEPVVMEDETVVAPPLVPQRDWLEVSTIPAPRTCSAEIIHAVSAYYGVALADLLSSRVDRGIVRPRHVAMYLIKKMTLLSMPKIGQRMGGKDHTTVLAAVRRIAKLLETTPALAQDIENIKGVIAFQRQRAEG